MVTEYQEFQQSTFSTLPDVKNCFKLVSYLLSNLPSNMEIKW